MSPLCLCILWFLRLPHCLRGLIICCILHTELMMLKKSSQGAVPADDHNTRWTFLNGPARSHSVMPWCLRLTCGLHVSILAENQTEVYRSLDELKQLICSKRRGSQGPKSKFSSLKQSCLDTQGKGVCIILNF